jgi:hypothetical protein
MLEYREKAVLEVAACTCDRCGLRMSPEDDEWNERVSLAWRCGFDSVFGDCSELSLDLCQHCMKATLGEWIRVSQRDLGDGLLRLATHVWDDATDADAWMRAPRPELGGKTPYETAATNAAGAERVEAILGRLLHGIPT